MTIRRMALPLAFAWAVLAVYVVPLSFASLLTGLVSSLGTPWGLFRLRCESKSFSESVVPSRTD